MATVPAKPPPLTPQLIRDTSVRLVGHDGSNGGSSIIGREIYGQTVGLGVAVHIFDLNYDWVGLIPKSKVQFWWRNRNAIGFSPFSDKITVQMLGVPEPPIAPIFGSIDQLSFKASYPDPANNGSGIFNRFLGFTTSPATLPTTLFPYHGAFLDTYVGFGLVPGGTYFVRGKVRNSLGDSAWGAAGVVHLIAGAWVKNAGVWREAVPYVRDAGTWKLVRPQGRILGIWEETG